MWHVTRIPLRKAASGEDEQSAALLRIVDAATPEVDALIFDILERASEGLSQAELAPLLIAGDQAGLFEQVQQAWEAVGYRRLWASVVPALQRVAVDVLVQLPAPGLPATAMLPGLYERVLAHIGDRIVAIDATTREAIRNTIEQALVRGDSVGIMAERIRGQVGLTPSQVSQVARFSEGLQRAGEAPQRIEELTAPLIVRLKRDRALRIARTETVTAANAGEYARLEQAVAAGYVDPGDIRRYWLTSEDDRVCPYCAPVPGLNPEGVGLEEPFQTALGEALHPALHPNCRCTTVIRIL